MQWETRTSHAFSTSAGLVKSPRIHVIRGSSPASSGLGAMSNATTCAAPLSTSISTSLRPTKPMPPVTTHRLGTGGNCCFVAPAMIKRRCCVVGEVGVSGIAPQRESSPKPSVGHTPQRHAGRAGRRCRWTMHSETRPDLGARLFFRSRKVSRKFLKTPKKGMKVPPRHFPHVPGELENPMDGPQGDGPASTADLSAFVRAFLFLGYPLRTKPRGCSNTASGVMSDFVVRCPLAVASRPHAVYI